MKLEPTKRSNDRWELGGEMPSSSFWWHGRPTGSAPLEDSFVNGRNWVKPTNPNVIRPTFTCQCDQANWDVISFGFVQYVLVHWIDSSKITNNLAKHGMIISQSQPSSSLSSSLSLCVDQGIKLTPWGVYFAS